MLWLCSTKFLLEHRQENSNQYLKQGGALAMNIPVAEYWNQYIYGVMFKSNSIQPLKLEVQHQPQNLVNMQWKRRLIHIFTYQIIVYNSAHDIIYHSNIRTTSLFVILEDTSNPAPNGTSQNRTEQCGHRLGHLVNHDPTKIHYGRRVCFYRILNCWYINKGLTKVVDMRSQK